MIARTGSLDTAVNALRRIVRAIRVSSHAAEESSGISGAQLFVLRQLVEHPGASLGEVARRTHTDESSVSVVVSRLVERRLVTRKESARDRRRVELTPTAAGRTLAKKAPEPAQARLVEALRGLPPRRLRAAAELLARIAREMGAGDEPASMFFERDPATATRRTAPKR